MTGFEQMIYRNGSDRSTNWATTSAHDLKIVIFNIGQTRPHSVYFRPFLNTMTNKGGTKFDYMKA